MFKRLIWCAAAMLLHMSCVEGASCSSEIYHLTATDKPAILTSPNYPNEYFNSEMCRWVITAQYDWEVVRFRVVDSKMQASATCGEDYAEVKDGHNNWDPIIRRWCGNRSVEGNLTGSVRSLLLTFRTDGRIRFRGFKLEYWAVPKGEIIYSPAGASTVNYALFAIFAAILSSITFSLVYIALVRRSSGRPSNQFNSKTASYDDAHAAMAEVHTRRRMSSRIASVSSTDEKTQSGTIIELGTPTPRTMTTPV